MCPGAGRATVVRVSKPVTVIVHRERTAIARKALSRPVEALRRHGLLAPPRTMLDYGCGRGDDLAGLAKVGVRAWGFDPFYRPGGKRDAADVVNLGFVLNVIDVPRERRDVLVEAYGLAGTVLAVSALVGSPGPLHRPYRDGVLSSRATFQKFYAQEELAAYVALALGRRPVAVGPLLFFVFRRDADERAFRAGLQRSG